MSYCHRLVLVRLVRRSKDTLNGAGAMICMQCMQTYIIDSYTLYAASGLAAGMTLRSLAGFGFPLFAPNMYGVLGYG